MNRNQEISFSMQPEVIHLVADPRRLKQVLVNLLGNAIKFTEPGKAVGLEVVGDAANAEVRLAVFDEGRGIPAELLPRLFQPFVQADTSLNRSTGGSGLGLALVRRMVEMHGGQVTAESTPGKGSRFTVVLPWQSTAPGPQPLTLTPTTGSPGPAKVEPGAVPRILLADDNDLIADLVKETLEASGYQVDRARDGREAVAMAEANSPDLILMDVQMPVVDGLEATRRIRLNPALANVPVLIVTAMAMPGDKERCLKAGASSYLSKPIRMNELLVVIAQWIRCGR